MMHNKIPVEQLISLSSNPNPRIRIPVAKINNQESIRIRRTQNQGQETSLSVRFPRSIVRLDIRWARMVTPRRWMTVLRTCIPTLGNIMVLGWSMSVSRPRSDTEARRVRQGRFADPIPAVPYKPTAGTP